MAPGVLAAWRDERRWRAGVRRYVDQCMAEPAAADVGFVARALCGGDADRAAWELRYLRRALALLVAQRDAADDRTGALVARELGEALRADRSASPDRLWLLERQFNERVGRYREAVLPVSGRRGAPAGAVAAALAAMTAADPSGDERVRLEALVDAELHTWHAALRRACGAPRVLGDPPP